MLNQLPKTDEYVWHAKANSIGHTFEALRKRTVEKSANPRLKAIHLHTFRHWYGTTQQHKWKDVYHVKQLMGHESVKSTEVYIHIDQMLSNYGSEDYVTKTATTIEERAELIELGFEKHDEVDGIAIYRKRK